MTITDITDPALAAIAASVAPAPADPNAGRVNPYEMLGHSVAGLTDVEEILESVGGNFTAYGRPSAAQALDAFDLDEASPTFGAPMPGTWVEDGGLVVFRDDTHEVVGKHGDGYQIIQYRQVIELALEAATVSGGAVDNITITDNGGAMHVTINLGDLILDPSGVCDTITRYLVLVASHNGKLPVAFLPSMMRLRCTNQLPVLMGGAYNRQGSFAAKHTKNVLDKLAMVKDGLGIADAARAHFVEYAEKLMAMPASETSLRRHIDKLWTPGTTDRAKATHEKRTTAIVKAFNSTTCVGSVGANRWAEYNAITEFGDHLRGTNADSRALATITPGNHVEKTKNRALELLLSAN